MIQEWAAIRPARKSDEPFIYRSWLSTMWDSHPEGPCPTCAHRGTGEARLVSKAAAKGMKKDVFMSGHKDQIRKALETCEVLIACNKGNDDQILSFVVAERTAPEADPVLHFAYTKGFMRKKGLVSYLLDQLDITSDRKAWLTHTTHWSDVCFKRRSLAFNPYLFWR